VDVKHVLLQRSRGTRNLFTQVALEYLFVRVSHNLRPYMSQSGILFAAIPASESLPCVSQQMLPQVVLHRKASLAHVALEGFTTARAV